MAKQHSREDQIESAIEVMRKLMLTNVPFSTRMTDTQFEIFSRAGANGCKLAYPDLFDIGFDESRSELPLARATFIL